MGLCFDDPHQLRRDLDQALQDVEHLKRELEKACSIIRAGFGLCKEISQDDLAWADRCLGQQLKPAQQPSPYSE
jgi:hypothetical protein